MTYKTGCECTSNKCNNKTRKGTEKTSLEISLFRNNQT